MALSPEYKEFIIDLFSPLGPIKIRAMFGGGGVYYKDTMFGLISGETLYLKVDASNRHDFEAVGAEPFVYTGKSNPVAMTYFQLPECLLDDSDELMLWARKSIEAALRSKKPKKKKPR